MTTRSQKRKAVAELVSGDFETPVVEDNLAENLVAGHSKNPRVETESLEEIKTSLRREIMSNLTKILAENQEEIFKLIAPLNKKRSASVNIQDSDSEPENVSVARTSTPVKANTATGSKTTPVNSRNRVILTKMVDLAEFGKNATQIMIFLPHYMWAENNNTQ